MLSALKIPALLMTVVVGLAVMPLTYAQDAPDPSPKTDAAPSSGMMPGDSMTQGNDMMGMMSMMEQMGTMMEACTKMMETSAVKA